MITAEDIVNNKDIGIMWISPDSTICQASALMAEQNIGAVLVKDEGRIIGIWTERDLVLSILQDGFDPGTALLRDWMNRELVEAPHTDTAFTLMDRFLGTRVRHILIRRGNEYIGLVSMGDAIKAALMDKTEEIRKLKDLVSWEYYENWKWKKKKGKTVRSGK